MSSQILVIHIIISLPNLQKTVGLPLDSGTTKQNLEVVGCHSMKTDILNSKIPRPLFPFWVPELVTCAMLEHFSLKLTSPWKYTPRYHFVRVPSGILSNHTTEKPVCPQVPPISRGLQPAYWCLPLSINQESPDIDKGLEHTHKTGLQPRENKSNPEKRHTIEKEKSRQNYS